MPYTTIHYQNHIYSRRVIAHFIPVQQDGWRSFTSINISKQASMEINKEARKSVSYLANKRASMSTLPTYLPYHLHNTLLTFSSTRASLTHITNTLQKSIFFDLNLNLLSFIHTAPSYLARHRETGTPCLQKGCRIFWSPRAIYLPIYLSFQKMNYLILQDFRN